MRETFKEQQVFMKLKVTRLSMERALKVSPVCMFQIQSLPSQFPVLLGDNIVCPDNNNGEVLGLLSKASLFHIRVLLLWLKRCICEILCPQWQQSPKKLFLAWWSKSRSQGHQHCDNCKGIISGVYMQNMNSLSPTTQKPRLKLSTDRQENRKGKNNIP